MSRSYKRFSFSLSMTSYAAEACIAQQMGVSRGRQGLSTGGRNPLFRRERDVPVAATDASVKVYDLSVRELDVEIPGTLCPCEDLRCQVTRRRSPRAQPDKRAIRD